MKAVDTEKPTTETTTNPTANVTKRKTTFQTVKDYLRFFGFVVLIPCLILSFTAVTAALCLNGYFNALAQENAINSGIIVEAPLVGVRERGGKNNHLKDVYYEFYDNGFRYDGFVVLGLDGSEAAHDYIDKTGTVSIYIDGKGHSIIVGKQPEKTHFLTLSIIFSTLFVAGLLFAVFLYYKLIKYAIKRTKKKNKLQRQTNK